MIVLDRRERAIALPSKSVPVTAAPGPAGHTQSELERPACCCAGHLGSAPLPGRGRSVSMGALSPAEEVTDV